VLIRPATEADVGQVTALMNALVATTTVEWTEALRTEDDVLEWMRRHEVVLVATDDNDAIVGLAAYGWFRDVMKWPGYRFTVEHTVHVRGDRWSAGVGTALMGALIAEAKANGMHSMVAAVDGENLGSVRFHERLGFVPVARMPELGAKFGRWLDLVLLQLRLDERPTPPADHDQ
jgi:phosphinothricin acetyltransferase